MNSDPCSFYLKNACSRGSSCSYSHQKPISGTKSSRSPAGGICHYYLRGICVYGDRCRISHNGESKEANANNSYNEGDSSSYESPVENSGIPRSDKGSTGRGEGEDSQEDVHDSASLPSEHPSDPLPTKEIGIEYAEPDVQDSGPSRDDVQEIIVDGENKEPCIFFLDGSCELGSTCDFSHPISDDTKTINNGPRKGPPNSST
ncbi:hypothetical protein BYT27DRAFT_7199086 [Phlegmacium glaucopus]|nr:hypothetical protein BYT27DRAFT_7199086 [Phlegmacium glaucopus]